MLEYYSERLRTYISNARKSLDTCRTLIPDSSKDHFDELDKLMKEGKKHEPVLKAYQIRRNPVVQKLFELNHGGTRQLWISIGFLGRLRSAYNVFIGIAPSFDNVVVIRVPKPIQQKRIRHRLSLTETMQYLQWTLDSDTVRKYVQRNATTAKIDKQFKTLQQAKTFVHAEVQIVLELCEVEGIFRYIGCSKRSCYMCWNFLRAYGAPQTKGSHGKLYNGWIIPELKFATRISEKLTSSIKELQRTIEEELRLPVGEGRNQIAESSIGLSRIGAAANELSNLAVQRFLLENRKANVRQSWTEFIRDRMQEMNLEDGGMEDQGVSRESVTIPIETSGECYNCEFKTSRRCSVCQRSWFCGEYCQSKMGTRHKFMCAIRRPLNSADYLYLALLEDNFPDDPQTLDDFGLRSLRSGADRSKLLGLFKGLEILEVPSEEVHRWQSEHTLEENIIRVFSQLSERSRGGYYPWFLQNRHRLTFCKSFVQIESADIEEVRSYLDVEDQGKSIDELKPEAKRKCLEFYACVMNMYHPPPTDQLYYDFGFCVCRDEYEEMKLGGLYQSLIVGDKSSRFWHNTSVKPNTCKFGEFWTAFEQHKLLELMDAKGLSELGKANYPRHFDTFMSGDSNVSVWDLKWFLADESWVDPEKCVVVDYGFSNCKTLREKLDLKMTYKTLLVRADPLELHRACVRVRFLSLQRVT